MIVPMPSFAQEGAEYSAMIHVGRCANLGAVAAELADAIFPSGSQVGADDGQNAATSFVTVPVSLDALVTSGHAINVTSGDETVACGEIGGAFNDVGALVIVLKAEAGSDTVGIAYLGPNAVNLLQTDVSLFVAGSPAVSDRIAAESTGPSTGGPTPTPTFEERVADYVPLADVRELAIRPGNLIGSEITFSGTILSIDVAGPGRGFNLGDENPQVYAARLQITVPAPDGTTEVVFIGYDGDTTGMFEGTWVTVYATVVGTQSFENAMGGGITQPLVDAENVLIG